MPVANLVAVKEEDFFHQHVCNEEEEEEDDDELFLLDGQDIVEYVRVRKRQRRN